MSDFIITTLPIEIKDELKIGALTSVAYASIISRKTECNSMLYLNSLNGFKNISIDTSKLEEQLAYYNINIDKVVIDKDIIHENMEVFRKLYSLRRIQKKRKNIYRCKCGRVELLNESLQRYTKKKMYSMEDVMRCKVCNSICECSEEEVLTMHCVSNLQTLITPRAAYENNFVQFNEQYGNIEILISRTRSTGIEFEGFNIDIDFFWSLFVGTLCEKNIVIISSNRHLFKLYIINQIADAVGKKIIFVVHPRIVRKSGEHISAEINKYDNLYRFLILLFAPKWKTQKCFYDTGMMKYIAKIRNSGRIKLYKHMCCHFSKDNFFSELSHWIEEGLNLQKNITEVMM